MRLSPVLGSATAFFYALGYPVGAIAVQSATPGIVLVARFVVAAAILAAIVTVRRLAWPRGAQLWHAVVVGLLTQGAQFVGCYEAMYAGVSPVLVALVIAMNPVITATAATLLLKERFSLRRALAVLLAMIAVCVTFAGRALEIGHVDGAVGWVVVAVLGLALGGIYQQRHLREGHPLAVNAIGVTVALVPGGLFALVTPQQVADPVKAAAAIAVLVIANSVIAATLYFTAIRRAGASAVSLLFGVIPSIAALLTWFLLGVRPDIGVIIGLAVGATACLVGNESPRQRTSAGLFKASMPKREPSVRALAK